MASNFWMRSQMVQGRYLYAECTQTPNVADNTSTIHWTLAATGGSSSFYTTGPTQLLIGGKLVYSRERVSYTTGQFPAARGSVSGSLTVAHDSDGNAGVDVTIYTMIYNGIQETRTEHWVLDPNPTFAQLETAPNFYDEEDPTITYRNPAGSNAASLQACISLDGSNADIPYRDISKNADSYTFSLTEAERDVLRGAFPNSNSGTVRFLLRSVVGGNTQVSSLPRTFTVKDPMPVLRPTITDSNDATFALTGSRGKLIRYYSNAAVTTGAAAVKKAALKSQKVTCGKKSLTADGTISAVESGSFAFTATDSRGNTSTKTVEVPFVEYIKPTCRIADNVPGADGSFILTVSGNFYNGSFGAKNNKLLVQYRYKASGANYGPWTNITCTTSGNSYTGTVKLTGLDYQTAYVIQAWVGDVLYPSVNGGVYALEKSVKAMPVFDWGRDDFKVNVPVEVDGVVKAAGFTLQHQSIYVGGDLNTYYPVHIFTSNSTAMPQYLFLKKDLGTESGAWSGNHSSGTSSLAVGWMYRAMGWDGNGSYIDTLYKHEPYAKLIGHVQFGSHAAYGIVLWLRGGGATYRLASNLPFEATVYLTDTNISTSTYPFNVGPLTTMGNGGVLYSNAAFLLDRVHPVNSIYIGYSHISPASLFGGTWARIDSAFLWACASSGTIGARGGASTHTLSLAEMPSHSHDMPFSGSSGGVQSPYKYIVLSSAASNGDGGKGYRNNMGTFAAGGGAAHNNMPPYIQVAVWRRTA